MERFLYWEQVQECLTQHLKKHGEPCTLYRAVQELWKEGQTHVAETLPKVSFLEWDIHDLDAFDALINKTPVQFPFFQDDLVNGREDYSAQESVPAPEVLPLRTHADEAQGENRSDSFVIHYIMRGDAVLTYKGKEQRVPQGSICLISPHFPHRIVSGKKSQGLSIFLAESTIESTLHKLFQEESILSDFFRYGMGKGKVGYQIFSLSSEDYIRQIMRNIFHEFYSGEEYSRCMCAIYVEILLTQILRQCEESADRYDETMERFGAPPMLAILKYIQTNYQTTSLQKTAEQFHYESSYLGKLLKSYVGKSYTDIVRELRLREAERLLRETRLSIEKVGEKSGFHNQVHFFREFRAAKGVTPGEYRKQNLLEKH